ncbi:amidohydrolase family protein [Citricoccus sp.]|uniref:amidohydrolase family protein n=1 Tax=Citricoccus sp. TaxID=1978372 RepID=UPI002B850828|nr:amidohydrolase family protein [Citricoccus sp.]HRO92871.1 amidohydrolase family protein [Citricoccus sp.]
MTTLYVNGTIHSASDPYATAVLVDGGSVAWVGTDDTADQMRLRAGADWEVVDLDEALVVPAFVDSLGPATGADPASSGVFLSVAIGTVGTAGTAGSVRGDGAATVTYRPVEADRVPRSLQEARVAAGEGDAGGTAVAGLAAGVGPEGLDAGAAAHLAGVATEAGVQVYFLPEDAEGLEAVIAAVAGAADAQGQAATGRARHRVAWNGPVAESTIEHLARLGVSVTVVPDATGAILAPVASLLARGVPVCLGTGAGPGDLWSAIRACLEHGDPDQRISARAGFTAATRAGLRALPAAVADRFGTAGRIAPSAPATFGIWATEALSVQAPDGRVAAWSTDTRAGTPLLPVLEEGTAAPRCVATVVDGALAHRS